MTFIAFDKSIHFNRQLSELDLRSRNPDLQRQLRRAASSIALNLAEGSGRNGRDRKQHFRIARGSALEAQACLLVAQAWGDLDNETSIQSYPASTNYYACYTPSAAEPATRGSPPCEAARTFDGAHRAT